MSRPISKWLTTHSGCSVSLPLIGHYTADWAIGCLPPRRFRLGVDCFCRGIFSTIIVRVGCSAPLRYCRQWPLKAHSVTGCVHRQRSLVSRWRLKARQLSWCSR